MESVSDTAIDTRRDKREIMGCTLGSILPLVDARLLPTIGLIEPELAVSYYSVLKEKGVRAASLQCEDYSYSATDVDSFSKFSVY